MYTSWPALPKMQVSRLYNLLLVPLPPCHVSVTNMASHMVRANCQHCSLTVVASLGQCRNSNHAKCHTLHSARASTEYVWECHILYLKIPSACSFGQLHGLCNKAFVTGQSLLCSVLPRYCEHTDRHQLQAASSHFYTAIDWHTLLLAASSAKH